METIYHVRKTLIFSKYSFWVKKNPTKRASLMIEALNTTMQNYVSTGLNNFDNITKKFTLIDIELHGENLATLKSMKEHALNKDKEEIIQIFNSFKL